MPDSDFAGAEILITGGLGFIGSSLARRLVEAGARVTIVDSLIPEYGGNLFNVADFEDRVRINIADVRDSHAMAYLIAGKHFLFNLAGQTSHRDSMIDPFTDLDINATSQLAILEACRKHNREVRVVFASTRQIYGKPEYLPVDEKHPIHPVDVNGINKLAGELYHLLYNNVYGVRSCALRLTNTYGPGMRVRDARQTFLGIWIRNLLEGIPIHVFGDGRQLRDFTYVDDAVNAFLLAARDPRAAGEVFNLGGLERVDLGSLASRLVSLDANGRCELVPFPPDREVIDIGDYYADFSKAHAVLGWSPQVPLAEGLARSVEFYRRHREQYW